MHKKISPSVFGKKHKLEMMTILLIGAVHQQVEDLQSVKLPRSRVEMEVDNSWVVPYCPVLSRMFNSHVNVEFCSSVKSIKYICKYVNKGSDMAALVLLNQRIMMR